MTGRLWPVVAHRCGEPPASLASRLAALHGERAETFCRDMRLSFQAIVDGVPAAVAKLADLARSAVPDLMAEAITRISERSYEWRGERLRRETLRRGTVMVCPLCLAEDLSGSDAPPAASACNRTLWQLAPIRTCLRHGAALVQAAKVSAPGRIHDFASNVAPFLAEVAAGPPEWQERTPSALETYLVGRLNGGRGSGWLDGLEWHAAAETCEMLGAVAAFGRDVGTRSLSEQAWHAAGDIGVAVASDGAAGVKVFLSDLDRTYARTRSATEGPQAVYGAFYKWLYKATGRPDLDPVRDVLIDHVVETSPVGPGDAVLGRIITERAVHSVHSAALQWKCHPRRLRKILKASGLIAPGTDDQTDDNTLFDARAAQPILDRSVRSIPKREAESYLNAGRAQTALLAKAGLIGPFVRLETKRTYAPLNYAPEDLDDFLAELLQDAVQVNSVGADEMTIPQAARRSNCGAMEIVRLILDRKLAWVGRWAASTGYRSVLVRAAEVMSHVHTQRLGTSTPNELEATLRTTSRVVRALISNGLLPTFQAINPINRCPVTLVADSDVREFQARYVSLAEIARQRGVQIAAMKISLAAKGISPSLPREKIGATFYNRSDLDRSR